MCIYLALFLYRSLHSSFKDHFSFLLVLKLNSSCSSKLNGSCSSNILLFQCRCLWQNIWKMTSKQLKPDVHTAAEEEGEH